MSYYCYQVLCIKKGLQTCKPFFMNLKMVGPAGLEPATKGL